MTTMPRPARRTLLTASAASAGALALTACGSGGDEGPEGREGGEGQEGAEGGGGGDGREEEQPGAGGALIGLDEVPVGQATEATAPDGSRALVFRADGTTVAAFGTVCTHQGCAVQPDGDRLHCPCHDSVFDAATGEVLEGPADRPLPAVPVRIEGQQIVVVEG
ncbi:Rieske (2Fe-2S) protein [Streptomyces sp. DSM 44917]|uniref:Cytochrome bc1 complex Rieske iron-sulfur subunit n=1 Tax=Streptomyces boetiae TaxID=3075541 RepID=A0ABU2LCI4_9ACTN|nr:Rieske (2Fe-2S) protein [Streptomyces sp. DSM 44917]MDT0309291.1 Rieske (2Fe-2S) protein [Streptomyces sp. DSM 44917]